jgi:Mg2+-importing ATPase
VQLKETLDVSDSHSDKVFLFAYLNSFFESGFVNPIDSAIKDYKSPDITSFSKLGEEPYDFIRKRLSILVSHKEADNKENHIIITKGSFNNIVDVCQSAEMADGSIVAIDSIKEEINSKYQQYSSDGYRTLGLAYKNIGMDTHFDRTNEIDMIFLGFITLFDPPKPNVADTIKNLKRLGVSLKIITGDNRYVAESVVKQIGFPHVNILTGTDLREINDIALVHQVNKTTVFAEIEPNQKERIILALKKAGHVVGYMGDGINDVSALHDADVGISVDSAVDVAKATADIVLLEKDLEVLCQGVLAGRRTFANTMKYVFMATSANFGNMFSMAGASMFLTFLPLLPKQVLLTNLLTDLPEMAIATDNVDLDSMERPHRWNISFIKKFMLAFGLISSIFDYMTFGALIFIAHASEIEFRTGWLTESVISAAIIVLVIRSKHFFLKSKPGKPLAIATLMVVITTLVLPYTPIAGLLGFAPLPLEVLLLIGIIILLYILTAELAKKIFYKYVKM